MLKEGTRAPDFTAALDDGTEFHLGQALGKSQVGLYFYPKDFTGGCTMQACGFRDRFEDITRAGATLLGVSADSQESHTRFRERYRLPFPLIADTAKRVIDLYDARGPFGLGTARVTYVIAMDGTIRTAIRHDILVDRHVPEVLAALAAMQDSPASA